jgi:protein O-mannosyl-transferase
MKNRNKGIRKQQEEESRGSSHAAGSGRGLWIGAAVAAVAVLFWAYAPSLNGPFLFDDNFLPFATGNLATAHLADWLRGVRPLLMASYWLNARISGDDTFSYHVVNLLTHLVATGLVFLLARKLLERAGAEESRRGLLAALAAALFLLHPVQTEAVAYLAGRSEILSVTLVLAAFTVFLYRPGPAISWARSLAVLVLFGAAILSKEHAVALIGLMLLTDLWWNEAGPVRAVAGNWRIYLPAVVLGGGAIYWFRGLIFNATTAGFGFRDFTWYQYFFTQCRALFVYLGLFLVPGNLSADWDFAISKTVFDHGAIVGLVLLVALAVAAWVLRKRFALAGYGFLFFLAAMAPTSSILPIADPIAERRLYFSIFGLILIVLDLVRRIEFDRKTLAGAAVVLALICAGVTRARAAVWSSNVALWEDTVRKSPDKYRPHFQLGFAYYAQGEYARAIPEFERASQLQTQPSADLLLDWGLALNEVGRLDEALAKLKRAALLQPSGHVFSQLGMIYAKRSEWPMALEMLKVAERRAPDFPETYVYRGKIYMLTGRIAEAIEEYRHALALNPGETQAQQDLAIAQQRLRGVQ